MTPSERFRNYSQRPNVGFRAVHWCIFVYLNRKKFECIRKNVRYRGYRRKRYRGVYCKYQENNEQLELKTSFNLTLLICKTCIM